MITNPRVNLDTKLYIKTQTMNFCKATTLFWDNSLFHTSHATQLNITCAIFVVNRNIILCDQLAKIRIIFCWWHVNNPSSLDSGKRVALFGSPCSCALQDTCATPSIDSQNTKCPQSGPSRQAKVQFIKFSLWYFWVLTHLKSEPWPLRSKRYGTEML